MYKLGVIGGMGPLATVKFYDKVVLNTDAHNDNEHIDLVVLNHSTMPDRTRCIIEKKDLEFLNVIKKDLEILDNIGVDVVAIPCNTSHYFYDEFKKTLKTILPEFEYITFNKELSEANIKFNINGFIKEVEFCYLTDKEKMLFVWAAIITLTNSVDIPFVFLQSVDKHLINVEFVNLFSKIQPKCENQQSWIATEQDDMPTSLQNYEQINQSVEHRLNPVLKLK